MGKKVLCGAIFLFLAAASAPAEHSAAGAVERDSAPGSPPEDAAGAEKSVVLWSPSTELYPRSIADPRRSGFAFTYGQFIDPEIAQAGDTRLTVRLGGSYGILRFHPEGSPDRGYQVDVGANFLGQFDLDHSLDNIGWDGIYHLTFTWADGEGLAFKLGALHDSSHVGDEYAERTGRKRFGYTREELVLGGSRSFPGGWRVYAETGRAYHRSNKELMDLWRAQTGIEYESPRRFWDGAMAWYAALDCSFYQENDWRGSVSIQTGVLLPQEGIGRRYRFGVEYERGRSVIGEFFLNDETVIAAGFWWDL